MSQTVGHQSLDRRPEPSQLTDVEENVIQYNQVMCTKLALSYAIGLELVHRARPKTEGGDAVDLASGPGHYTLCLARYLGYERVTGADLSAPMVEVANRNAADQRLADRVGFGVRDVTKLQTLADATFDLASFTGAAHHMPDLDTVAGIVREMDRIARPDGLVMVMDLARLRTEKLTERYVRLLGQDYVDRGLSAFLDDFRNSMYAEWTPKEFRAVIPTDSPRWWCHLVPRGLPTVQVVFGLPVGRKDVFVRGGHKPADNPLIRDWYPRWQQGVSPKWADETLQEWKLMRMTLSLASKRMFPPGR